MQHTVNSAARMRNKMAAAKKVFDVAKPGSSPPDTTTRPLIVGHKSEVTDSTLAKPAPAAESKSITIKSAQSAVMPAAEKTEETEAVAPKEEHLSPTAHKIIQPISHDEAEADAEKAPAGDQVQPPTPEDSPAEAEVAPSEPADEPSESSDAAVLDAVVEQTGSNKKSIEDAEAAAQKEALEKLIASKQYFLKIDESKHVRGFERFMIGLLLVLLLGLIGFDLAIDAGLIETDIKPFVDLIKN